jgi:hypothetical protein
MAGLAKAIELPLMPDPNLHPAVEQDARIQHDRAAVAFINR